MISPTPGRAKWETLWGTVHGVRALITRTDYALVPKYHDIVETETEYVGFRDLDTDEIYLFDWYPLKVGDPVTISTNVLTYPFSQSFP